MKGHILVLIALLGMVGLLVMQPGNASAATKYAYYEIRNDSIGGDCTIIGTWDAATKTCTVTEDLTILGQDYFWSLGIREAGITLDGNGHTLTGPGKYTSSNRIGIGVSSGSNGFTVKGFTIQGYGWGVFTDYNVNNGTISGNTVIDAGWNAIHTRGSGLNILDNTLDTHNYSGIMVEHGGNNVISGNFVTNGFVGVRIVYGSRYNVVSDNVLTGNTYGLSFTNYGDDEVYGNTIQGFHVYDGANIVVYNNNFIGGPYAITKNSQLTFNLGAPTGGNYWAHYDSPAEGCFDADGDSFCDSPMSYKTSVYGTNSGTIVDNLPWTKPDGWLCQSAPGIEIASFSPEAIWPANHRSVDITVTGQVIVPDGCTLADASFSLTDEYGEYSSSGALEVAADGSFSLTRPAEATRAGSDRDGRTYTLVLSATDDAGTSQSAPLVSTVLHDMRK